MTVPEVFEVEGVIMTKVGPLFLVLLTNELPAPVEDVMTEVDEDAAERRRAKKQQAIHNEWTEKGKRGGTQHARMATKRRETTPTRPRPLYQLLTIDRTCSKKPAS